MILILRKKQQIPPSNQSGFTIMEALVAVLVVGILLTAIAPVIVLSVATRVQARRVELASDAAKSYIDGVSSGTIAPPALPSGNSSSPQELKNYNAPSTGTLNCTANNYCSSPANNLYCIDGDGSGCSNTSSKDLIIQAFRYNKDSTDAEDGYSLGLRVYRADAFNNNKVQALKASKDTGYKQQKSFTGGTGLTPIQTPLIEITTDISEKSGFDDFCARLKNDSNNDNVDDNEKSKC